MIAKCCTDINTDIVYSRTGYDVNSYFRCGIYRSSETENAACHQCLMARGPPTFTRSSGTTSPTKLQKKTVQHAPSEGSWSKFSGASFCLLHRLVGFLFVYLNFVFAICNHLYIIAFIIIIPQQEGLPLGGAVGNATSLIPQRLSYIMLAITCSENVRALPCIGSHGRLDRENSHLCNASKYIMIKPQSANYATRKRR